jgi:pimeloyl-ACP methyl ester carboxylesterase
MDTLRTLTTHDRAVIAYRLWRPAARRRLLVLLHGVASNMTRWSELVSRTTLRDSWDILRLDLRGMGRSVYRGRIGMPEWCADLAAILEFEGYPRAVVAGHCLGANIAVEFAARDPAQAMGLILIEPMPHAALAGAMRRTARVRPLLISLAYAVRALNALGLYRHRIEPLDLEQLDRETRAALAAGGAAKTLLDKYASPLLDLRTTPAGAYLQALIAVTGRLPELSNIAAPVLALLSSGGTLSDPRLTRAALAALPECEIVGLQARHWIPTEQPDAMRAEIENWIGRRFRQGDAGAGRG